MNLLRLAVDQVRKRSVVGLMRSPMPEQVDQVRGSEKGSGQMIAVHVW
jgi:hypothetical protein